MIIETVRTNAQGKEQLSRLKRYTGVENWNILCRWAFCVSLAEGTVPPPIDFKADDGVEMTWKVFGGQMHEVYLSLLKERCKRDSIELNEKNISEQFRLHLHRGLGYLSADTSLRKGHEMGRRSVSGLLEMVKH